MYRELFGEEWYHLLKDYLEGDFKNIGLELNEQYKYNNIIPEKGSELYFKVFRELQPSQIHTIIFGQDPYPQKGIYTGYAFDNANSSKLSPSLANIFKEIDRTYPENQYELILDRWDLQRWIDQGVFLVNVALTVVEGSPGAHLSLWKPFTIEWIQRLCKVRNDLVWLLWGSVAQDYAKYINNPSHYVINTGHPSPLNTKNPFVGSGCFAECNQELVARNKNEILW